MSAVKRLFVAVPLPEHVLLYVQKVQRDFQKLDCFAGSFILPVHQHITLSFLGDVSELVIEDIQVALADLVFTSLQLRLSTINCFSFGGKIRVIFIHVICPELIVLAAHIQNSLSEWIELEKRAFVPHITLARVKTISDRQVLLDYINRYEVEKIVFACDEFILFESVHVNGVLEHRVIQRYKKEL